MTAVSDFLSHRERSTNDKVPPTFAGLPEDVLLQIFAWLSVRDILALRSVNKRLFEVTMNSAVWVPLLRRLTLALPPWQCMPSETPRYRPLHTVEFFVSRALKLEHNWRDYNPLPKHYRFKGHQHILAMKNLPGGKHMVSVSEDPTTKGERVVIWDMNFRGRRNHVAIAMLNSETPVQKLQVRYAVVNGQECLLTAFTRPPVDGKTTITAVYVNMELLENLSRHGPGTAEFEAYSRSVQDPFSKILETRTRYPVGALSLSDIQGRPVLATVHRPRTIAFYFLDSGKRASLKLTSIPGHDNWRHSIWEIKLLPSQNQILVIRILIEHALSSLDNNMIVFEIYDVPPIETDVEDPTPCDRVLIQGYMIDGFYVSDADASWWSNTRKPQVQMLHEIANCVPPPISIFVTTREPRGFLHYLLLPEITHGLSHATGPHCIYKLPSRPHAAFEWAAEEQPVIIPGAYRSVVWMRSARRQPHRGIEILQLAIYRTEGYTFSDAFDTGHTSTVATRDTVLGPKEMQRMEIDDDVELADTETQDFEHPRDRAMKYPVVPGDVAQAMRRAMQAIQFDEWLGRLCVATTEDTWVHVLDWSI